MIKAKTLQKVLAQALTSSVQAAILFDLQGSLLAFAGEDINSNQMVAAIVANVWGSFEGREPGLETLLFEFEQGRIAASRSSQFVVCVYGSEATPLGMLKAKAVALAEHLAPSLDQVLASQQ